MKCKPSSIIPYLVGAIAGVLLAAAFLYAFYFAWQHIPLIRIGK